MFEKPSLVRRVAVGKAVGLAFGAIGFVPVLWPDAGWSIRWGILLWYPTVGAVIGALGVFTYHPVLRLPLPWWVRAPALGGWMNFVLTFFVYEQWQRFMTAAFGAGGLLQSPFWFVADGLLQSPFWFVAAGGLVGLAIGYFATRFGGEGKGTVGR